jgi:hypothetical protein
LEEWRDRTIQRIGDGAEDFGFAGLDDGVEGDGLDTGGEDILLYLRDGLGEAVEGGVEVGKVARNNKPVGYVSAPSFWAANFSEISTTNQLISVSRVT